MACQKFVQTKVNVFFSKTRSTWCLIEVKKKSYTLSTLIKLGEVNNVYPLNYEHIFGTKKSMFHGSDCPQILSA